MLFVLRFGRLLTQNKDHFLVAVYTRLWHWLPGLSRGNSQVQNF